MRRARRYPDGVRYEYCLRHGVIPVAADQDQLQLLTWRQAPHAVVHVLEQRCGAPACIRPVSREQRLTAVLLDRLRQASDDAPAGDTTATRGDSALATYLNSLVLRAAYGGASDLAISPYSRTMWQISARVGTRIVPVTYVPETIAQRLVTHLAARARLDVMDQVSPQDGMITLRTATGEEVRLRVSLIGDRTGQYAALRILSRRAPELLALGFTSTAVLVICRALEYRDGLVLIAGPTGSGKTTTMAALLQVLVRSGRRVVTLEDPVEYRIPGATQIERLTGGIAADAIAAAMRQDPDVLALGEMRSDTHAIALADAVLSGHLVVASVHAGNGESVRDRLLRLGMPDHVLSRSTRIVVIQHLERTPPRLEAQILETPWLRATWHLEDHRES